MIVPRQCESEQADDAQHVDADLQRKYENALRALRRAKGTIRILKRKGNFTADGDGKAGRLKLTCGPRGSRDYPDYSSRLSLNRGGLGRMLPTGMLALGLRKSLGGYVSSRDVAGILVDPKLHRWTVVNAELTLHQTIMASTIHYHQLQLRFSSMAHQDACYRGIEFSFQITYL